jgi:hypothetical protein
VWAAVRVGSQYPLGMPPVGGTTGIYLLVETMSCGLGLGLRRKLDFANLNLTDVLPRAV